MKRSMLLRAGLVLLPAIAFAAPLAAGERGAPLVRLYDLQEEIRTYTPAVQLLELADGRIAAVTIGGIAIFDGVRWRDARHPDSLVGAVGATLAGDGRIVMGFDGDVGWFEEEARGHFRWHSEGARWPVEQGSLGKAVGSFLFDDDRTQVHVGRGGLLRLHDDGRVEALAATTPWALAFRLGDTLWLQDLDGRVSSQALRAPLGPAPLPDLQAALGTLPSGRSPFIRSIIADGPDAWLLFVSSGRILRFSHTGFADQPTAATERLASKVPYGMTRLRDGRLLLISAAHGPVVIDSNGDIVEEYGVADGVPLRITHDALEDRQGGLWLAQAIGVLRIDRASGITRFDEALGLEAGARGLVRWRGDLYASGGFLYRLVPGTGAAAGHFETILPEELTLTAGVAVTRDRLFVARSGLAEVERTATGWRSQKWLQLPQVDDFEASARTPGRLWLAHARGVHVIDVPETGELIARPMPGIDWPVRRVVEDPDGSLWIADGNRGLWRIAPDGRIRSYDSAAGVPAGSLVPHPGIDRMWFASVPGALLHDRASDRLVSPEWLPEEARSSRLYTIHEDRHRHLWLRGDALTGVAWWRDGRYELDRTVLQAVSTRPQINAFLREDDIVWVARARDVLRVDLAARRAPPPPSPPLLAAVMSSGRALRISELGALAPEVRDLSFAFGSPDPHRAEALEFRSQLEGFDKDFSPWSRDAQRIYTNLPDGHFELRFESRDGYGRIASAAPLAITIAAPWYRTTTARLVYLALLLALLYLAAQWGARRRQRLMLVRQQALEQEVARRTAEIATQAAQLREQAGRLADLDRLKTDFFVHIGHEFRTPLTLVMGPLDDVLSDSRARLGTRTREQLELALRNARRVLDLIVELLDVNRLEHGQLPLSIMPCEFDAWLRGQLAELAPLVARHGHQLEYRGPTQALPVAIDPVQMGRVIANLVGNACKYMARGGRIEIMLGASTDALELAIRDHGCGIEAAQLPHVFDRFHRAEPGRGEGFGVGLALAKEIVERHGGRIEAESTPGEGTTLRVRLPLTRANSDDAHLPGADGEPASTPPPVPVETEPNSATIPPQRERACVLVVDDHAELRQRLVDLLGARYEVWAAGDGPEALRMAQQQLPDVIVSDVMMPGFDGVELALRLRAQPETRSIALLLLTAKVGSEHAVAGLEAGADDYLAKPFDAAELLARVAALLARARRLQMRIAAAPRPLPRDDSTTRWMQRLEQHIDAQLHDSAFDVEALARAMHLDRSALFRHLKQHTALGPAELLRERRLLRAQALLREGAGSVTEIAFAVGFDSLSGFTRAFRSHFGHPPSDLLPRSAGR